MFCEGCFVRCLRCTSQRISNSILARLGIVLENRERWNKNTGEEKARSRKGGQFRFHSDFFQKSDEISGQRKFLLACAASIYGNSREEGRGGEERGASESRLKNWFVVATTDALSRAHRIILTGFQFYFDFKCRTLFARYSRQVSTPFFPPFFLTYLRSYNERRRFFENGRGIQERD